MTTSIFNPRDQKFKKPYGAQPCGTLVTVTLRPSLAEGFVSCALCVHEEFAQRHKDIPLSPAGPENGCALFTGTYTLPEAGELVWYRFRFQRENGETLWLGKNGFAEEGDAQPWQQTVYDGSFATPRWFGKGVTYQIFPDRFRRTRIPDPAGMLGSRRVHLDWRDGMDYLPDEGGEVRNDDFFGGNLAGIEEKLEDLQALGVTTLYLCPIFESDSNHRYNTADYLRIDPMLGDEEDFHRLCRKAHSLGIRVMLDGVFNHTGNNSRYFNAFGAYPDPGAAQSMDSPYYEWYTFQEWPDKYDAWWGIKTLPAVREDTPSYVDFIAEGEDSVIRHWLRAGADAWRLDVADELPDEFIAHIRRVMMEEKPDSFLLGEVWEDGSNKVSYDRRRKYLLGNETHGLMNYPFRVAALAYLQGGDGAEFMEAMEAIRENYPPAAFYSAMNLLGTHDTPRVLTLLGTSPAPPPEERDERASYRLTAEQRERGLRLLRVGAMLLFTFPGSPTIYYGDEAGMEGFEDPFNRATYPWGQEDLELKRFFARMGMLRKGRASLQAGGLRWLAAQGPLLAYARETEHETTVVVLNAGEETAKIQFPWPGRLAEDAVLGQKFQPNLNGTLEVCIPGMDGMVLI